MLKIASALSGILSDIADYIPGIVTAGGQVRYIRSFRNIGPPTQLLPNITLIEVSILKSFEPAQMGAYLNEAEANEVDHKQSFWGANYPKPYAIKAARDLHGLYITRKGVGSEIWDGDGLGRITRRKRLAGSPPSLCYGG
ncbi:hypothetical protein BZG36_03392 [Bifiguratus adelaidae]|uniref:Berberine/berberine-like domain-containing protein n=1 Tax=Bifiguratus adelaidae TaxID=1938954 RepID=A0A261Y0E1_9FUNG|nr:hypothetical protein BZG36_03392 [Bifiguratus adelaidae]